MCGCQTPAVMSDRSQIAPVTKEREATLAVGTSVALLLGIVAGTIFAVSRKRSRNGSRGK